MPAEVDLYAPVKALLEGQGYDVKGEVLRCDVVGVRGDEPPVVVELKRRFSLDLVLQGIDRLALTDRVYLAVGDRPRRIREVRSLCRRLGLGLLVVDRDRVEVLLDPLPYRPRGSARRRALLLGEHARRIGDPNRGGSTRVKIVTAYRQEALRCAALLQENGPMTVGALRAQGEAPNAGRILQQNVYGWFQRVARGTYALTPAGSLGLARFGAGSAPAVSPADRTPGPATARSATAGPRGSRGRSRPG